jgi:ABC-type transport system involved in multi-copper enzyme maturation permease subunit
VIARLARHAAFECAAIVRRNWYLGVLAAGVLGAVTVAVVAAGHDGAVRDDSFRSGSASLLLVGGLTLALALGATTISRGAESGHLGLLVASGAPRAEVALVRILARLAALALAFAVWLAALEIAGAAIGRGADGPLVVHAAATGATDAIVLLAAAATSTVLGPTVAAIVGLMVHVTAQAVVNLEAAADQGRLGAWSRLANVAYNLLPRAVLSPMIVDLQNRGQGGPAAPQFEINQIVVPLTAAGIATVLWTVFWCALLAFLCVNGTRRRTLS